jgi:hypothetical protein
MSPRKTSGRAITVIELYLSFPGPDALHGTLFRDCQITGGPCKPKTLVPAIKAPIIVAPRGRFCLKGLGF